MSAVDSNTRLLLNYLAARYPQFVMGVEEAQTQAPERFATIAGRYLKWLQHARGDQGIRDAVDDFVRFTTSVNMAQARYEACGHYENSSFDEVYDNHYSQREQMDGYLWGVYLTNFLWAHHLQICLFFEDRFLRRLPPAPVLLEIAPGHGGWGIWALHRLQRARLEGYDISPSSIDIASSIARAAGVAGRTEYSERNALDLASTEPEVADAVICSFLVEHLEQPQQLFAVIEKLLRPGGVAFLTGALTAAQVDHIYEFRHESELLAMAESNYLRALETLSTNPRRLLRGARFVPRSMAMLLYKPRLDR